MEDPTTKEFRFVLFCPSHVPKSSTVSAPTTPTSSTPSSLFQKTPQGRIRRRLKRQSTPVPFPVGTVPKRSKVRKHSSEDRAKRKQVRKMFFETQADHDSQCQVRLF